MISYAPVTWEAGAGLVLIMAGIIVYNMWPSLKPPILQIFCATTRPRTTSETSTPALPEIAVCSANLMVRVESETGPLLADKDSMRRYVPVVYNAEGDATTAP